MAGFAAQLLIASAALAAAPPGPASPARRLPPVDQCSANPSFAAFRRGLDQAIARRDRAALLAALADDVLVDFGGGAGRDAFAKIWFADRPSEDALWAKLERILGLGCAASGDNYLAPSLVAQFDPMLDATEVRIAGAGTPLLGEPRDSARVLALLDWDILTVGSFDGAWLPVSLADGRNGFVRADQVHSPMDYRLTFERIGGSWRITSFVAGD